VLEGITLAQVVELVVEVLINLSGGTVLDEKPTKNTETAHPQNLGGHTSILGTFSLTETSVAARTLGGSEFTSSEARVHGVRLFDDKAILVKLADGLAGIGVSDLVHFVGVEPHLSLSDTHDRGRKALLCAEIDHLY